MSEIDWVIDFMNKSPSAFHFIDNTKKTLDAAGFIELKENEKWTEIPQKFYVVRRGRSLIAMNIVNTKQGVLVGNHCDFPAIYYLDKPQSTNKFEFATFPEYGAPNSGTMIAKSLKLAGRVVVKRNGQNEVVLFDSGNPIFINDRFVGISHEGNPVPKNYVRKLIADRLNIDVSDIIQTELILVSDTLVQPIGTKQEKLIGEKFDDNICAASSLYSFIHAQPKDGFISYVIFDNEEIGSNTFAGAKSSFISDVMTRAGISGTGISSTLFISSDVAHAFDALEANQFEAKDRAYLGKGPCVAFQASKGLSTDTISMAILKLIAQKENLPLQKYTMPIFNSGGVSIGRFISHNFGMHSIEYSIPVLSMHSHFEVVHKNDIVAFYLLLKALFEHYIEYSE